jgi:hypothetical protein
MKAYANIVQKRPDAVLTSDHRILNTVNIVRYTTLAFCFHGNGVNIDLLS